MKINNEKRRKIWDDYCKAEFMLQNLKSIVQNECEITDNEMLEHFGQSSDLADTIIGLHNEVVRNCK